MFAIMMTACGKDVVFNDYKEIAPDGWHKDSAAIFDVQIDDEKAHYTVLLHIRNRSNYGSQNLWLFTDYQMPDSTLVQDTLSIFLADKSGRWLGSGFGSLHDMPVFFLEEFQFPQTGNYRFYIQQGMRDTLLTGINDIGLEVIKN